MLSILPKDIVNNLFIILPITAKRNFIRCNHELNLRTTLMAFYENEFMTQIKIHYKYYLPDNLKKLEKYTLEMIYDNCEHLIPKKYICNENKLCNDFMFFYCAKPNNLQLLKILLSFNSTNNKYITYGAANN